MTGDELNEVVKGLTPEQRDRLAGAVGGEVVAWLNRNVPGWQVQKNTEAAVTRPKESRTVLIIWGVALLVVVALAIIHRN